MRPEVRERPHPVLWLWAVGLLVCAASLWRTANVSADHLAAPFDLAYETPNLRSIELLQQGAELYDPAVYGRAPWWITSYTPLYHRLVALFPASPSQPFLPGRLVALGCMLLAAGALLAVGGRAVPLSLLAVGLFFLVRQVTSNTAFLKNDSLALLLSAWGVVALARARGRLALQIGSAVLCALALGAKQSFGAAAAGCLSWLLLTQPRRGLLCALVGLLTLALALAWDWSEGFLSCVRAAQPNPLLAAQLARQLETGLGQPVLASLALLGVAALVRVVASRRWAALRATPYPLYALASVAVLLLTLPKVGSSPNYFIEPTLAVLMALLAWGRTAWEAQGHDATRARRAGAAAVLGLALASGAELTLAQPYDIAFTTSENNALRSEGFARMKAEIAAATRPGPRVLNLFYAGLSYPVFERLELDDPLLYFLLWDAGWLPPDGVVAAVRGAEFDAILVPSGMLEVQRTLPPPPDALLAALRARYAVGLEYGDMQVLLRQP